jgi:nitrate reductase assembly molybdenum cofactor insertion protein NarJ
MGLLSYQLTFQEAGFETPIETPDYLPAVLELAATVDSDLGATVLQRAAGDIGLLRGAVAESDEPLDAHVALLDLVLEIAKSHERTVA